MAGSQENQEQMTEPGDVEAEEERGVEDVRKSASINIQLRIIEGVATLLAFTGILCSIIEYEISYLDFEHEKIKTYS